MKTKWTTFLTIFTFLFISGCATNGSHLYVDGKCISCWNNPITQETLDYETAAANNYFELTWQEMMLEGLSRNQTSDLTPYGEDYLRHKLGNKVVSMKNNEISYQRAVNESVNELASELSGHTLKQAYQVTVPSQLGEYNFENNEFPLRLAEKFTLKGGNNIKVFPSEITVSVNNIADLPNLEMNPDDAEAFLNGRNNSRTLYIRYIVEIVAMSSPSSFQSKVREIQFIDVKPSIVTREKSEQYQPFRAIKI